MPPKTFPTRDDLFYTAVLILAAFSCLLCG